MSRVTFMNTIAYCAVVGDDLSALLRDHYGGGVVIKVIALENIDAFDDLEYQIGGIPRREVEIVDDFWVYTYHIRT